MTIKMTPYILLLILVVGIGSCSKRIASEEQCDKFNSCNKIICENKNLLSLLSIGDKMNDSITIFHNDICNLSLDELLLKYQIEKAQIDPTIESICITSDLINSFRELELRLNGAPVFNTDDLSKMMDSIKMENIKPQKFNPSNYKNVSDTTFEMNAVNMTR